LGEGDGAKQEIGDVGEDRGSASGDEVGFKEFVELGEGVVDANGGGELVAIVGESLEEVGGGLFPLVESVPVAEGGVAVSDGKTAEATGRAAE